MFPGGCSVFLTKYKHLFGVVCTHELIHACIHVIFEQSKNVFEAVYLALWSLHFLIEFSLLSWTPFKNAVCCVDAEKRQYWTKLMCIFISKPMHCRSLWLYDIILLSVFYKSGLHAPRYPIQDSRFIEMVLARYNLKGDKKK